MDYPAPLARLIDELYDVRRQILRPVGAACDHHEEESDPEPANDLRLAVLKLHALSPVQCCPVNSGFSVCSSWFMVRGDFPSVNPEL